MFKRLKDEIQNILNGIPTRTIYVRNLAMLLAACLLINACVTPIYASEEIPIIATIQESAEIEVPAAVEESIKNLSPKGTGAVNDADKPEAEGEALASNDVIKENEVSKNDGNKSVQENSTSLESDADKNDEKAEEDNLDGIVFNNVGLGAYDESDDELPTPPTTGAKTRKLTIKIAYWAEKNTDPGNYSSAGGEIREEYVDPEDKTFEVVGKFGEHDGYIIKKESETITLKTGVDTYEVDFYMVCVRKTVTFTPGYKGGASPADDIVILSSREAIVPDHNPDTLRPGYIFDGYYDHDNETAYDPKDTILCNELEDLTIVLEAQWLPYDVTLNYEVKDNAGGDKGSVTPDKETLEAASEHASTVTANPADGYHLKEWTGVTATGSEIEIKPAWIDGNRFTPGWTYYPKWTTEFGALEDATYTAEFEENVISVKYEKNTEDVVTKMPDPAIVSGVTYFNGMTVTSAEPERTGYTFLGWSTDSDAKEATMHEGDSISVFAKDADKDKSTVSLYAVWKANTYKVEFKDKGGAAFSGKYDGTMPEKHTYGTDTPLLTATRIGYELEGWYDDKDCTNKIGNKIAAKGYTDDITVYANWVLEKYSITYHLSGGTDQGNRTEYYYTDDDFSLIDPIKTGYTFTGWTWEGQKEPTKTVIIKKLSTGDKEFTANWRANNYTITFDGAGKTGGTMADEPHTYGTAKALNANTFTRSGYVFAGWSTLSEGPATIGDQDEVLNLCETDGGKVKLYAKWSPNEYTICFDGNGADGSMAPVETYYDVPTKLPDNRFEKDGYTFSGWADSPTGASKYKDGATVSMLAYSDEITLYAVWALKTYTINYDLAGGGLPFGKSNPSAYFITSDTFTLVNPVKDGYEFMGWSGTGIEGTSMSVTIEKGSIGERSYTANWEEKLYHIQYNNLYDATGSEDNPDHYTVNTDTFTLKNPERVGYTFSGWNGTGLDSSSTSVTIYKGSSGDRTYTAGWSINKYTISFRDEKFHTVTKDISAPYTMEVDAPASPSTDGWTFTGWYTQSEGGEQFVFPYVMQANDITLYAHWSREEHTVSFDARGIIENPKSVTGYYGAEVPEPSPVPSATGYIFNGWFTDAACQHPYSFPGKIPGQDMTIYAGWTEIEYDVYYDTNYSGGVTGKATRKFTQNVELSTPSRGGYAFTGWYEDKECSIPFINDVAGTTIICHLFAGWVPRKYKFTYDINTGEWDYEENTHTVEREYHQGIDLLEPGDAHMHKDGYTFGGWYTSTTYAKKYEQKDADDLAGKTDELTVYAKWDKDSVTLTYSAHIGGTAEVTGLGGTFEHIYADGTYTDGSGKTVHGVTATAEPGYTFSYWSVLRGETETKLYEGAVLSPEAMKVDGLYSSALYVANFAENTYNVEFYEIDDDKKEIRIDTLSDNPKYQGISYNTVFDLPTFPGFTKTGFHFDGWYIEKTQFRTPGQQVNCLATEGTVKIYTKWLPYAQDTTYVSTGYGTVSREHDEFSSSSAGGITDVVATTTIAGYTFDKWMIKTGDSWEEVDTEGNILTAEMIKSYIKKSEEYLTGGHYTHYTSADFKADFKEVTYNIYLQKSADDTNPYKYLNVGYSDKVTLKTWAWLIDHGYPQFNYRGATFANWGDAAYDRTFADAQDVSQLTTKDGETIVLINNVNEAQVTFEYANTSGGTMYKLATDSSKKPEEGKYFLWSENAWEDIDNIPAIKVEADINHVFSHWLISIGGEALHKATESAPIQYEVSDDKKIAIVKPLKQKTAADDSYTSYSLEPIYAWKPVTVEYYNYKNELVKTQKITYGSDAKAIDIADLPNFDMPEGMKYFVGWAVVANPSREHYKLGNCGSLSVVSGIDNADVVKLYPIWDGNHKTTEINYVSNANSGWLSVQRECVNETGTPYEKVSTGSYVLDKYYKTYKDAKAGEWYWRGWATKKDATDAELISTKSEFYAIRNADGGLDYTTYYALFGQKPYGPATVTVQYGKHAPVSAQERPDVFDSDTNTATISTTADGGSTLLTEAGGYLRRKNWKALLGESDSDLVSVDQWVFAGWYKDNKFNMPWIFDDDVKTLGSITNYGDCRNIYAKWNAPESADITYYAAAHGHVHTIGSTNVTYQKVYITDKPSKDIGAVAEPNTGYHVATWSASRPNGTKVDIPSEWISNNNTQINPEHTNTIKDLYESMDYAVSFDVNHYKVKFYNEGELLTTGVYDDYGNVEYNTSFTMPNGSDLVKNGYTLKGWKYYNNSDNQTLYTPGMTVSNLTPDDGGVVELEAVWSNYSIYISYETVKDEAHGIVHVTGEPLDVKTEGLNADSSTPPKGVTAIPTRGYHVNKWNGKAYSQKGEEHDVSMPGINPFVPERTSTASPSVYERSTYTVSFAPDEYTVSYHYKTASYSEPEKFVYDVVRNLSTIASISEIKPEFKPEGYSFAGWATSPAEGADVMYDDGAAVKDIEEFDDEGKSTFQAHLYAKYKINSYNINFNTNGGSAMDSVSKKYGAPISNADIYATPTRTGYKFDSWNKDLSGTMPAEDITLIASWSELSYNFTYDRNGGVWTDEGYKDTDTRLYTEGITLRTKADINKVGYEFGGWYKDPECTSGNEFTVDNGYDLAKKTEEPTVYAKWIPGNTTKYTIKHWRQGFNDNYDDDPAFIATQSTDDSGQFIMGTTDDYTNAAAYVKTTGEYAGFTVPKGNISDVKIKGDGSSQAVIKYQRNKYAFTYDFEGHGIGTVSPVGDVPVGKPIAEYLDATPYETGYTFISWNDMPTSDVRSSKLTLTEMPSRPLTAYANWKANSYTVKFDGNEETGGKMKDETFKYGIESTLNPNKFYRAGYTFAGWATKSEGPKTFDDGATVKNLATASGDEVTLFAQWTPNTYTVKYNGIGTNVSGEMQNDTFTYASESNLSLNAYTRTGYTFTGWATSVGGAVEYTDGQPVINLTTTSAGVVNLYTVWDPNSYKVEFVPNGSTSSQMDDEPFIYDADPKALSANTYVRPGYDYNGWSTTKDGSKEYSNGQKVRNLTDIPNGTVKLYAVWNARTDTPYEVRHLKQNVTGSGYTLEETDHFKGTSDTKVTPDVRTTYTGFSIPDPQEVNITADGSLVVEYRYDRNEYKYTLGTDSHADTTGSTETGTYRYGTEIELKASPSTGYDFTKWESSDKDILPDIATPDSTFTLPAGDVIMTPQVSTITYHITYHMNEGINPPENVPTYTIETEDIVFADPSRTGYIFDGWYTDEGFTDSITGIAKGSYGDVDVYAKWNAITYSVQYHANKPIDAENEVQGINKSVRTWTYNTSVALDSAPSLVGYTFKNWVDARTSGKFIGNAGDSVKNLATATGSEVHIYANWEANTYHVAFNGNGATKGSMVKEDFTFDVKKALTLNGFSKTGYTFEGWSLTQKSGKDYTFDYEDGQEIKNLTATKGETINFYAVWKPITFTLQYADVMDGAVTTTSNEVEHIYDEHFEVATISNVPKPKSPDDGNWSRDAWLWIPKGWNTDKDGNGTPYKAGAEGKNIGTEAKTYTLYAQWERTKFKFTYNFNYETSSQEEYRLYEKGIDLITPTRPGYTFDGWFKEDPSCAEINRFTQDDADHLAGTTDSLTVYAKWTPIVYNVKYHPGTPLTPPESATVQDLDPGTYIWTYDADSKLTELEPKLTGYTFKGWYDSKTGGKLLGNCGATVSNANLTIASGSEVYVYARWEAKSDTKYIVKHYQEKLTPVGEYPSEPTETITYYGKTDTTVPAERQPYAGFMQPELQNVRILADGSAYVEYYYKRLSYEFTLGSRKNVDTDGSSESGTYRYDAPLVLNASLSEYGYDWNYWRSNNAIQENIATKSDAHFTMPAGNLTMTPDASLKEYDIKYYSRLGATKVDFTEKSSKGNYPDTYNFEDEEDISNPLTSARPGYGFLGWTKEVNGVESTSSQIAEGSYGDTIFYANYSVLDLSADAYYYVGNVGGKTQETIPYTVISNTPLPTPTATGYTFAGWKEKVGKSTYWLGTEGKVLTPDDNTAEFHARWLCDFTYVKQGDGAVWNSGNPDDAQRVVKRENKDGITLNYGLSKTGYHIDGWYTEPDGGTKFTDASASELADTFDKPIVYLKWAPNTYTLTFDKNKGDTVSPASKKVTYDAQYGELAVATRSGYTFAGWFTEASGGKEVFSTDIYKIVGNQTLYAHWTANQYVVSFDRNKGDTLSKATMSVTFDSAYGALASTTRTGYAFDGWFTEKTGGAKITDAATVKIPNDHTLYAQWTANTYVIEFHGDAKTTGTTPEQTLTYDASPSEHLNANGFAKIGYTFAGWSWTEGGTKAFDNCATVSNLTSTPNDRLHLYALWDANHYKVEFDGNGSDDGSTATESYIYDEAKVLPINGFTRTGYTFKGWAETPTGAKKYGNGESVINLTAAPDGIVTLYAVWEANDYVLRFDNQGGSQEPATTSVTYDSKVPDVSIPLFAGYTFKGYFAVEKGSGKQYYDAAGKGLEKWLTAGDGKVYAKWTANQYTITFEQDEATTKGTLETIATFSEALPKIEVPKRTGYTFNGYYVSTTSEDTKYYNADGTGTKKWDKSADMTLHAKWTANKYVVTFDKNGGTAPSRATQSATYDSAYGELAATTREGYDFAGWYTATESGTLVTSETIVKTAKNHTLYALWNPKQYKITFEQKEATKTGTPDTTATFSEALPKIDVPERTGYTFKGYYVSTTSEDTKYYNADGTGTKNWDKAADTTLHAKWEADSYEVSFDKNGGDDVSPATKSVTYDAEYGELASASRTGYTFAGWYTEKADGTLVTAETVLKKTGNHTLYAHWTANSYELTFDNQGGGNTPATTSVTYDSMVPDVSKPVFAGYTFKGYFEGEKGSGKQYYDETGKGLEKWQTAGDGKVYAKWTANQYTITFEQKDATKKGTFETIATFSEALPKIDVPERTGYTFDGYYVSTDSEDTKYYNADGTGTKDWDKAENMTLHAKWTANKYVVTFDKNGGTAPSRATQSATFDSAYGELATTTREGYEFAGWYTATESGTLVTSETIVKTAKNHTLYALWNPKQYKITFEQKDATKKGTLDTIATFSEALPKIEVPERTGYTFKGYYVSTTSEDTKYYNAGGTGTKNWDKAADTTLHAKWEADSYEVSFDKNGGDDVSPATKSVTYDSKYGELASASRTGYTFAGWYTEKADGTLVTAETVLKKTGNHTLYAHWTANGYTLYFDNQEGSEQPKSTAVVFDATVSDVATPSYEGHAFAGYFENPEGIGKQYYDSTGHGIAKWETADNGTVYALWVENQYTITFEQDEATKKGTLETTATYSQTLPGILVPERTGYTFNGYYLSTGSEETKYYNADGTGTKKWDIPEDTELHAKWTPNDYELTFDNLGGSLEPATTSVTYDSVVPDVTIPIFAGYTFRGYFENSSGTGKQYYDENGKGLEIWKIAGSGEVYAKWTANQYTITFEQNDATKKGTLDTIATFSEALPKIDVPERTGYTFNGYYVSTTSEDTKYYNADGTGTKNWDKAENMTLHAKWTANSYEVTFDKNKGDTVSFATKSVVYDSKYGELASASRTGYTFAGWYDSKATESSSRVTADTIVKTAKNHTLYAYWTANQYKITFEQDEATKTGTLDTIATFSEALPKIDVPERTGYTFKGYYVSTTSEETKYYNSDGTGTKDWDKAADTTLHAKWEANKYVVSFDKNGGDTVSPATTSVTFDATYGTLASASRTGYTFAGWYTEKATASGTRVYDTTVVNTAKDHTLYAHWTANSYELTFDNQGGSAAPATTSVTYDSKVPDVTIPVFKGYTFNGYFEGKNGSGKQYYDADGKGLEIWKTADGGTVYAKWTANQYTITFEQDEATTKGTLETIATFSEALPKIEVPERIGYTFDGYYVSTDSEDTKYYNADGTGTKDWNRAEDTVLHAKWTANKYVVSFDGNEGATPSFVSKVVTYDSAYGELATTSRTGYTFTGWYTATDSDVRILESTIVTAAENHTLYAQWSTNVYTITLHAEGGSPATNSVTATYSQPMPDVTVPVRPGYIFKGYYDATTSSAKQYFDENGNGVGNWDKPHDTDMYARWEIIVYSITYDLQGGSAVNPETYTVEDAIYINNPTKTGFRFKGWIVDGIAGPVLDVVIQRGTTGNKTFKAVWQNNGGPVGGGVREPKAYIYSRPGYGEESKGTWIPVDVKNRFWKLRLDNGELAKNGWVLVSNPYSTWGSGAKWYHFNADGFMDTGWIKFQPDEWYYLWDEVDGNLGTLLHGWHHDKQDGYTYYLDLKTGRCYQGWNKIDGKWYYFSTLADVKLTDWVYNAARYVNPDNSAEKIGGWVATTVCDQPFGSMWINKMTPDGHRTGPDGVLIE